MWIQSSRSRSSSEDKATLLSLSDILSSPSQLESFKSFLQESQDHVLIEFYVETQDYKEKSKSSKINELKEMANKIITDFLTPKSVRSVLDHVKRYNMHR